MLIVLIILKLVFVSVAGYLIARTVYGVANLSLFSNTDKRIEVISGSIHAGAASGLLYLALGGVL